MKIRVYFRGERSEEEEVPDPGGLDPGDVGGGAGEDAGLVLHCAADGTKTDHAVHLPTIPVELTEQRPPGVALAGGRRVLFVSKPGTDHRVPDAVAPELLLSTGFKVDDGQTSLVQSLGQRHVLLPSPGVAPARHPAVVSRLEADLFARQAGVADEVRGQDVCAGLDQSDVVVQLAVGRVPEALVSVDPLHRENPLRRLRALQLVLPQNDPPAAGVFCFSLLETVGRGEDPVLVNQSPSTNMNVVFTSSGTNLQRDLPGPGVRSGLVPRDDPLGHVGFKVGHSTVFRPVQMEDLRLLFWGQRVRVHMGPCLA